MKLPRVRFTVRRLMIAVGGIAVVIFLILDEVAMQIKEARWRKAAYHAQEQEHYSGRSQYYPKSVANPRLAAHHARMKSKWYAAASSPFLPVAPDPPEPE